MECAQKNDNILTCNADLFLKNIEYLDNLTKTLYVGRKNSKTLYFERKSTNLIVTINKPKTLKLLGFDIGYYYSYGVSLFNFKVNFYELCNSSVSIKFGNISITKCEKIKVFNHITCEYEFPESYNGKTLNLTFNGVETNYYIEIKTPPYEFKGIRDLYI